MRKTEFDVFANGATTAALAYAVAAGARSASEQSSTIPLPAKTSLDERAAINKAIAELNVELSAINKGGGFLTEKIAAAWYHDNVHPLGIKYDTEFGAKIFKNQIFNGETLVTRHFGGTIVTQHYSNQVNLYGSTFGSIAAISKWHTHGATNADFTIGADIDWADAVKGRSAYISRNAGYVGSGIGISLDVWRSGQSGQVCGASCGY